jgi:hypothetical protein
VRNNKRLQRMIDRNVATVGAREVWAVAHGLSYAIQDPLGLDTLPLAVLSVGSGHVSDSVVSGHWKGVPVVAWDLTYWQFFAWPAGRATTGFTSQRQFDLSCGMVLLPRACPRVILVPSKRGAAFARKAARKLRMARVLLPQPIGNDWTLYSQDDRFGKLVAGSPLQHRLRVHERFGMEIAEDALVVYGTRADPTALGYLLDTVVNLRNQILPAVDLLPVRDP